jgi:flagellar M-ring protein FliF
MRLPQGTIKRLSASVLVDQKVEWEGPPAKPRRRLVPPDAEKMKRITDVVAAAIGLQSERGDRLVVETLPFESTLSEEPPPAPPLPPPPVWRKVISDNSVLTPIAICFVGILLAFVLRRRVPHARPEDVPATAPAAALAIAAPSEPPAPVLASPTQGATRQLEVSVERELKQREQIGPSKQQAAAIATEFEKLYTDLSDLSSKDPKLCANVLRTWLTETAGRPQTP